MPLYADSASESDEQSEMAEKAQRRMDADPRWYIRYNWGHPNNPQRGYDFRADDETPLLYLTDDDSPLNPEKWGDINIFKFARGCLKTTSCVGIANWFLDRYPMGEVDVTAPRSEQTGEVVDRFKERAEDSGLADRRVRDNISHQKFKTTLNMEDDSREAYAHLKSRSGWGGGDGLRGLHGQIGIIDEFQDTEEGMFSTFLEVVDQGLPTCPYVPAIFCIGTPKTETDFFADLWSMSDRKTWDSDKLEWVQQDEPGEYGHAGDSFEVRGWHIDQYNSPLHDKAKIEFKKETYSKRKFQNEVLAEFYSPEDDLITKDDVKNNVNRDIEMQERRFAEDSDVTLGVDWGGGQSENASKTVISVFEDVGEKTYLANLDILHDSLEPQDEIERVEELLMKHDVDKAVVDYGHGNKQLKDLQDGNGTYNTDGYLKEVKGCQYGNVKNKYDPKWETDTGKERFFTIDRGFSMEKFVEDFKQEDFVIPAKGLDFSERNATGTVLVDHLTAPYKEKKETRSGRKTLNITTDKGRNDDVFQSMVYAAIAQRLLGSTRQVHSITSRDRQGY